MKYSLVALGFVVSIVLTFQNCGPANYRPGENRAAKGFEMEYPYASKPAHYTDAQMLVDATTSDKIKQFKLLINVGESAPRALALTYSLNISDPKGAALCPASSGTLQVGETQIVVDCVSPYVSSQIHVRLVVTENHQSESYDFLF
jgi:hypothetical protein